MRVSGRSPDDDRLPISKRQRQALKNLAHFFVYLSAIRVRLWFWQTFAKEKGGPIFDALAMMISARRNLVRLERRAAAVETDGTLLVR